MKFVTKFLKNSPELFFFYLFILSIPLGTKITFLSRDSYFTKHFLYYTTFFVYLSDILLITTLILWIVNILYNKYIQQSRGEKLSTDNSQLKINSFFNSKSLLIIYSLLFSFIFWSFFSSFWAKNSQIGLYQSLKLIESILLLIFVIHRINTVKILFFTVVCLVSTGFTQAVIGIWQYFIQHSIGFKWLGESILNPDLAGVAKIVVNGEKIIRIYGTFPHPNVLAGFLFLSIICSFWLLFLIKTNYFRNFLFNEIKKKWLFLAIFVVIYVQIFAFILTFSRIAWTGMVLLSVFSLLIFHKNVSRETFANFRFNKPKIALLFIILFFILYSLFFIYPQISGRIALDIKEQAFSDRLLFNNIAFSMIKENFFQGVGIGNFTLNMADFSPVKLEFWQYQPVHNIYLLIFSELGIIGFILFVFIILNILKMAYLSQKSLSNFSFNKILNEPINNQSKMFHVKHLANNSLNKAKNGELKQEKIDEIEACCNISLPFFLIFIGFLFIGLFDHYFWTIQSGQLVFWLIAGLILKAGLKSIQ